MRSLRSIGWVVSWPVRSQDGARRNAQRAAIACAQRRRERETVERYLAELHGPRSELPPRRRRARSGH